MCSVHKVTLNFIHVLYTIILSFVLLFVTIELYTERAEISESLSLTLNLVCVR